MTRIAFLVSLLALVVVPPAVGQQTARKTYHDYPVGYLEYLPPSYASADKEFPLLIFLHGGGEVGDGSVQSLQKVKAWGPPSFLDSYDLCFAVDGEDQCFIVLSPQLNPQFFDWNATVRQLLDHVFNGPEKYKFDPDRIYLTGLSRGGLGVYQYAAGFNNRDNQLAAIAPIAAWSEDPLEGCIIAERKISVWAFHGKLDTVVPHALGEAAFRRIRNCSDPVPTAELIFTTYDDRYHDSWIPAYSPSSSIHSPNLYQWLLTKKRMLPDPITSLQENEVESNLSIYPNPASDEISVYSSGFSAGMPDLSVLNVTGELVMRCGSSTTIDIRHLPAGTYILQTQLGGMPVNRRFVKVQ